MTPRAIDADVLSDAQSATPSPVLLVQLATGAPDPAYFWWTTRDHSISFGGVTFEARPVEVDETTIDTHTEKSGPKLRVMDLDGALGALVAAGYDFARRRVRLWRTAASKIGSSDTPGMVDDWLVDFYERAGGAFSFALKPILMVFSTPLPRRSLDRSLFPGIPDPD